MSGRTDVKRFSQYGSEIGQDQQQFQTWTNRDRGSSSGLAGNADAMEEAFGALLLYLGDGYDTGTCLQRVFAVLYRFAPQLVESKIVDASERNGISNDSLSHQLMIFDQEFPKLANRSLTSLNRRVALADIRNRRRELRLQELARESELREKHRLELLELRHSLRLERKKQVRFLGSKIRALRERLRLAERTIELARPLQAKFADDMRAFDAALGLPSEEVAS